MWKAKKNGFKSRLFCTNLFSNLNFQYLIIIIRLGFHIAKSYKKYIKSLKGLVDIKTDQTDKQNLIHEISLNYHMKAFHSSKEYCDTAEK